jgi:hypothetical protein
VIAGLAGVALDARFAVPNGDDPATRARVAQWIAANALACRGLGFVVDGVIPRGAYAFALRARSLAATLAAIAVVPALLDLATLPRYQAYLLRLLGLPVLSESPAAAISGDASVLGCVADMDRHGHAAVVVDEGPRRYRVRIAATRCMLAS